MLRTKRDKFVKDVEYYNYPEPTDFVAAVDTQTLALTLTLYLTLTVTLPLTRTLTLTLSLTLTLPLTQVDTLIAHMHDTAAIKEFMRP